MWSKAEYRKRAELSAEWSEWISAEVEHWFIMNVIDRTQSTEDRQTLFRAIDEENRLQNEEPFFAS